jgi:hypothetical protein
LASSTGVNREAVGKEITLKRSLGLIVVLGFITLLCVLALNAYDVDDAQERSIQQTTGGVQYNTQSIISHTKALRILTEFVNEQAMTISNLKEEVRIPEAACGRPGGPA